MLSRHFAGLGTPVFLLLLTLGQGAASEVKAQDAANPVEKAQKLNRYAMELFDDQNFALAEKTLLDALGILEKANLAGAPASLATHGNLAILYSVGLKDANKAVAEFKKALAIKPDLKLSKQRTSPETEANLARAKAGMGGAPAPVKPEPPAKAAATVQARAESETDVGGLRCPTSGEILAGDDVTLKCLTSDPKTARVLLYYKANGAEDYQTVPMTKGESAGTGTAWVGVIPGSDTNAKWVPIYYEAQNSAGRTLASSGRPDSPNVITVKGAEEGEAGDGVAAEGEEEGEAEQEEEEEIDDSNPLARLERQREREREGLRGTWTFAFGLGSGFGYAGGDKSEAFFNEENKVQFKPGLAPAYLGHAVIEIGYFIGRKTALTLTGRHQYMPGMQYGAATGAHSALLRLLFFSEPDGKLRWYFSTVAGGGEGFRLRVSVGVLGQNRTYYDTVRGGPFLAGLGGGMLYKVARRWYWTVDTQVLVGFPSVSAVLDLTTGIRWMH